MLFRSTEEGPSYRNVGVDYAAGDAAAFEFEICLLGPPHQEEKEYQIAQAMVMLVQAQSARYMVSSSGEPLSRNR